LQKLPGISLAETITGEEVAEVEEAGITMANKMHIIPDGEEAKVVEAEVEKVN